MPLDKTPPAWKCEGPAGHEAAEAGATRQQQSDPRVKCGGADMMNTLLPIRRIEAMFDDLMTPSWRFADGETSVSVTPRADILEGEKEYRIQLDLPGVDREDLAIEVEGETLTISAKRNAQAPDGFKALHNERADVV